MKIWRVWGRKEKKKKKRWTVERTLDLEEEERGVVERGCLRPHVRGKGRDSECLRRTRSSTTTLSSTIAFLTHSSAFTIIIDLQRLNKWQRKKGKERREEKKEVDLVWWWRMKNEEWRREIEEEDGSGERFQLLLDLVVEDWLIKWNYNIRWGRKRRWLWVSLFSALSNFFFFLADPPLVCGTHPFYVTFSPFFILSPLLLSLSLSPLLIYKLI